MHSIDAPHITLTHLHSLVLHSSW